MVNGDGVGRCTPTELHFDNVFRTHNTSIAINISITSENSPSPLGETQHTQHQASQVPLNHNSSTQRSRVDVSTLLSNPADRNPISYYDVNDRDEIRRAYIQRDLIIHNQSIQAALHKQSEQVKIDYKNRLNASIDIGRLLLISGLPFRGHDESEAFLKKGNFLTFLEFFSRKNKSVGSVALKNALSNNQMTSPSIQKDIINACYKETINDILKELGDDYFPILVDESRDVSCKKQMGLLLTYVDKKGFIMERLVGLAQVTSTTAESLKGTIYFMLDQLSLSPSRTRGHGYDGASNKRGHVHGLRTLIQEDCSSAHYVHCFAHQFLLTLVKVAHKHVDFEHLIDLIQLTLNTIGVSYKHRDEFRQKQAEMVEKTLRKGELITGKGLNQEVGLQRHANTR
ncbi:uncharacterized protein LOC130824809 [Amaranthus tricolor]|uniref:uncharacterized protein LOC130824809 n=1 Tax=Amaranthus tricolor TaxID=29722 RepID=UPI00258EA14C|nr:uncharacterized protein LOC130824809 [Amaranthus tricolor]